MFLLFSLFRIIPLCPIIKTKGGDVCMKEIKTMYSVHRRVLQTPSVIDVSYSTWTYKWMARIHCSILQKRKKEQQFYVSKNMFFPV